MNTLHEVIQKEQPSHLGVAFDPSGPTFRDEAFADYKAQREKTPEDIKLSVPIIKQILEAMNIPILEERDTKPTMLSVLLPPKRATLTWKLICLRPIKTMDNW